MVIFKMNPEKDTGLTQEQVNQIAQEVSNAIKAEADKPLKVSIMGQTGVGKSSLLNALFNTKLKTDPIRPCTKEIEQLSVKGNSGHELLFYDLPGIGESEEADKQYLEQYSEKLKESDVVLWAIHADSRSVAFDVASLDKLLSFSDEDLKSKLISKITFVLTKADLITPPPWIFGKTGDKGLFAPQKPTQHILEEKASYYQEVLLSHYSKLIVSQTYNDDKFQIDNEHFYYDDYTVSYRGFISKKELDDFKSKYPKHKDVFDRLYDNYQVIPCSSLFKFNLSQLMLVIINKLGKEAINRFKKFTDNTVLNELPLSKAKEYCNIVVVDAKSGRKVFDLTKTKI